MSVQTKTFTVTLSAGNQPQPLDLAGVAVGFTTTRWVVVNNLTPYTLLLANVGDAETDQRALAPGTANKYPWTNKAGDLQATWINPITGAPPSTPQVIVEYSDDPQGADLQGAYPTTLSSGVTIGTLTGPVSVTGSVAVSSVAGNVSVQGGPISLAAGTAVQVSNNVSVTPTGTVNVQGVVGGTTIGIAGAVTVASGNITISGTPTVNIASGQSIAISGTPAVTITGTPNVNVTAGSLNVGTVGSIVANVNVNTAVESIFGGSHTFTLGSTFTPFVNPITQPVEAFRLTASNSSLVQFQQLQVLVQNTTTGQSWQGAITAVSQADLPPFTVVAVPVAANVGDTVVVTVTNLNNPGAVNLEMVGLQNGDIVMTPPGEPLSTYQVQGNLQATIAIPNGVRTQILPAPPAGMAYRLTRYGLVLANGTQAAYQARMIECSGPVANPRYHSALDVFPVQTGSSGGSWELNGQTATTAVQILQVSSTTATTAFIVYDLISKPEIV